MLKVRNMHASYGKFDVLKGISIEVQQSQIVALIGPNGAGKSTVFRSIFGLMTKVKGEIIFKGENIIGLTPVEILRRGISYVFQRRSVFPGMTVEENLKLGAYIRDDHFQIGEDIERLYGRFPILRSRKGMRAGMLSGGEQRMLEIARALLLDPEILMLDEPTLGLAPKVVDMVFKEIRTINEAGTTVAIVEQNAKKALEIADYAYVLVNGLNKMEGPAKEVRENPEVIKSFLGGK
jgi:ABC-type branched-subunit amino acid transport system ATPase component